MTLITVHSDSVVILRQPGERIECHEDVKIVLNNWADSIGALPDNRVISQCPHTYRMCTYSRWRMSALVDEVRWESLPRNPYQGICYHKLS